jgi:hypothetical protein
MSPPNHQQTQRIPSASSCALHSDELRRISETVTEIHHRLFVDNGKPCHQTRLDRLDSFRGLFIWFGGTLTLVLK